MDGHVGFRQQSVQLATELATGDSDSVPQQA